MLTDIVRGAEGCQWLTLSGQELLLGDLQTGVPNHADSDYDDTANDLLPFREILVNTGEKSS